MENNNEIRNRIIECVRNGQESDNAAAFVNAMYGFYVRNFNRVCYHSELPEKLADELISANARTKLNFLELVEELNTSIYDRTLGLRVCSECGNFMHEGYYLAGDYACSDECAIRNYMRTEGDNTMSKDEAEVLFRNDLAYDDENCAGEVYWTEW